MHISVMKTDTTSKCFYASNFPGWAKDILTAQHFVNYRCYAVLNTYFWLCLQKPTVIITEHFLLLFVTYSKCIS